MDSSVTLNSWHKRLIEDIRSQEFLDFRDYVTLFEPTVISIDIDDVFVTDDQETFLRALAYYFSPSPYFQMEDIFMSPACFKVTKGWRKKTTHYVVPTDTITLVLIMEAS